MDKENENIEETFNVHWAKKNDAKLKLKLSRRLPDDDSPFFYSLNFEGGRNIEIKFQDLVGIKTAPGWKSDDDHFFVVLFHYPFVKTAFGKHVRKREKLYLIINFSKAETKEQRKFENENFAAVWSKRLKLAKLNHPKALKNIIDDIELTKQNWLLVINPAGGKGKAVELTDKHVLPMLNEADFSYEKIVTTHQGHAEELIKNLNYKDYTGVALVGGDGLFHEGVNGLMQREDRAEVIQKLSFYQIPGGSGNCVAASLVYSSTGILIDSENLLINALVLLTTGRRTEMGLSLIQQPDEDDKFSFLLAFWGLYAKIDFESEKYRKAFGGQRFLVSAVANIANPPLFDGHIEVLEAEKADWRTIEGPFLNVGAVNLSHIASDNVDRISRDVVTKDTKGKTVLHTIVLKNISRTKMTKILLAGESGTLEKTIESMKDSKKSVEEFYVKGIKFLPKRTENDQFLDVDGERFPYKPMEITPTDLFLNVIAGYQFYDL